MTHVMLTWLMSCVMRTCDSYERVVVESQNWFVYSSWVWEHVDIDGSRTHSPLHSHWHTHTHIQTRTLAIHVAVLTRALALASRQSDGDLQWWSCVRITSRRVSRAKILVGYFDDKMFIVVSVAVCSSSLWSYWQTHRQTDRQIDRQTPGRTNFLTECKNTVW